MKSVIVTGGTIRLGREIADYLAQNGWRVLRTSHRAEPSADIVVDLAEPDGARKLWDSACRILGGKVPDALVNNAAIYRGDAKLLAAVNLAAPLKITEMMFEARRNGQNGEVGAVVDIFDAKAIYTNEDPTYYAELKREFMRKMREQVVNFVNYLRINAVAPGPVLAPVQLHEAAGKCPFGRPSAREVASAVGFLLSAGATTGCIIPVDGGRSVLI